MTIEKVMHGNSHEIVCCEPTATVEEAARMLASKRIGALPVMRDGKVVGIFSERDVLYCIAKEGAEALFQRVSDVMTAPAISVDLNTSVNDALAVMTRRRIRHLTVEQNGKMVGFVSIGDLVKYRIELVTAEAEQMREYIQTA